MTTLAGAAISDAMQRPSIRFVPVKSEEQQGFSTVHRARDRFVRRRTMRANSLRAALGEFGIVAAQGLAGVRA